MNNFILLQKIRIREFLNSLSKKKALSTTTLALMVLLLLGVFIFLSISFNYSIYYALKVTDNLDIYYPTMASLSLLIIIITAVTNLKGTITVFTETSSYPCATSLEDNSVPQRGQ